MKSSVSAGIGVSAIFICIGLLLARVWDYTALETTGFIAPGVAIGVIVWCTLSSDDE